jgi:hypothetical protein
MVGSREMTRMTVAVRSEVPVKVAVRGTSPSRRRLVPEVLPDTRRTVVASLTTELPKTSALEMPEGSRTKAWDVAPKVSPLGIPVG